MKSKIERKSSVPGQKDRHAHCQLAKLICVRYQNTAEKSKTLNFTIFPHEENTTTQMREKQTEKKSQTQVWKFFGYVYSLQYRELLLRIN